MAMLLLCSASYAGLGDWENAANDAAECVKVDKGFLKGGWVGQPSCHWGPTPM